MHAKERFILTVLSVMLFSFLLGLDGFSLVGLLHHVTYEINQALTR